MIHVIYPILDIDKVCTGPIHEGGSITYTVKLINTGHQNATGLTVTDFIPNDVVYIPGSASATSGSFDETALPGSLQWKGMIGNITGVHTVNITIPVTDKPAMITDTIMNNASYTELLGCENMIKWWDSCETLVIHPEITLTKDYTQSSQIEPANIIYTYTVTNTGDTPLSDVYVYDETHVVKILGLISLNPTESDSSTFNIYNVSEGTYTNTANATGIDFLDLKVEDHDTAVCTIRGDNPPPDVGGEIYAAITTEQRLTIIIALILLSAGIVYRIKE
ncbi:MAG: hypothetical protein V1710_09570 [Candidatus Bathyarchaeota archaeon]